MVSIAEKHVWRLHKLLGLGQCKIACDRARIQLASSTPGHGSGTETAGNRKEGLRQPQLAV
jgi:hypothetical protein